ncbi:MAG: hypothetical protein ABL963_02930 [Longimicrobiales bacterium]
MKDILNLLRDNQALTQRLQTATSIDDAAEILSVASREKGKGASVSDIKAFLANRPKADALSEEDLMAVAGGLPTTTLETKLSACSKVCCKTCRTSVIVY